MSRKRRYCPSGRVDTIAPIDAGYDDVQGTVDQAAASAALTYETYRDTPLSLYWMRHDQNDAMSLRFQMRHGWDFSAVEPHFHVLCAGPSDGVLVLDGYYAWTHISGSPVLGPLSAWTPFRVTASLTAAMQWTERGISLGLITPPDPAKVNSANLWMFVRRPGAADPADTYQGTKPTGTGAANIGIVNIDAHVRVYRFGSANLYTG